MYIWFATASCLPFVPPLITLWTSSCSCSSWIAEEAAELGRRQSRPLQRTQNWINPTHTHTPHSLLSLSPPSLSLLITSGVLRASECEKPPWRSHQGSNQRLNTKCALLLWCDDGGKRHRESLSGAKISAYANWTKDLNGFDVHKSIYDPDVVTSLQEKEYVQISLLIFIDAIVWAVWHEAWLCLV